MSWPAGKKINTHDSTPHSPAACVANLDPQDQNSSNLYLFWCGNDSKLYWSPVYLQSSIHLGKWVPCNCLRLNAASPECLRV